MIRIAIIISVMMIIMVAKDASAEGTCGCNIPGGYCSWWGDTRYYYYCPAGTLCKCVWNCGGLSIPQNRCVESSAEEIKQFSYASASTVIGNNGSSVVAAVSGAAIAVIGAAYVGSLIPPLYAAIAVSVVVHAAVIAAFGLDDEKVSNPQSVVNEEFPINVRLIPEVISVPDMGSSEFAALPISVRTAKDGKFVPGGGEVKSSSSIYGWYKQDGAWMYANAPYYQNNSLSIEISEDGSTVYQRKNGDSPATRVIVKSSGGIDIGLTRELHDGLWKFVGLKISYDNSGKLLKSEVIAGNNELNQFSTNALPMPSTVVVDDLFCTLNPTAIVCKCEKTPDLPECKFPSDYIRDNTAAAAIKAALTSPGQSVVDPFAQSASEVTNSFFPNTFPSLTGWALPQHDSVCPVTSFNALGQTFAFDAHCSLFQNQRDQVHAVMAIVWSLVGFRVIFRG